MGSEMCIRDSLCTLTMSYSLNAQDMDNDQLEEILVELSDSIAGQSGAWQLVIEETFMLCFTDEANNRMRIISPIAEMNDVTDEQIGSALEANFHSALDVRYAISDGIMWSAFIHPLRELSTEQAIDAVIQVYSAAVTFGDTYASTNLSFPKATSTEEKTRYE